MKIVMFTDAYWPRVNGVTVSVDSFSHALIRLGHEVMIVCPFYPESSVVERISDSSIEKKGNPQEPIILRVPSMPLFFSKEDRLAKFHKGFWVSKQIEEFNPDMIHLNSEFIIAEFGVQYARFHSIPAAYTFHTHWDEYIANYLYFLPKFVLKLIVWGITKPLLKRIDAIIVPSIQIGEVVKKFKIKKKTYLLPTGTDPHLFSRDTDEIKRFRDILTRKYPPLNNKRILLFVGRIAREKNLEFLLGLAPEIIKKHPELVFLMVGNGPDLYELQEQCAEMGLRDSFVFTGYLDREDVALTYGMSHIFVFPSLTESQGLVTIEAMLSGIPVVAIGAMGTLQVMGGDNGGFMVKNDREEFKQRVFDLLEDEALYRRKSAEAKQHAQGWTIDTMALRLEGIYHDVLNTFKESIPSR
ncbi:glycosyl transferase [Spirochaetia bacterium]|nr:glycosyl transferase [Spirochaetia bacterium]